MAEMERIAALEAEVARHRRAIVVLLGAIKALSYPDYPPPEIDDAWSALEADVPSSASALEGVTPPR